MKNQVELLNSIGLRNWVKRNGGISHEAQQSLQSLHTALLTLAQATHSGNIPAKTLPLNDIREYSYEAALVLQQFARYFNCQAKVHGLPTPFFDLRQTHSESLALS